MTKVKVKIDVLNEVVKTMEETSEQQKTILDKAAKDQLQRVEGSEGRSIDEIVSYINHLHTILTVNYPSTLTSLSMTLSAYNQALKGSGFSEEIWSETTQINKYIEQFKEEGGKEIKEQGEKAIEAIEQVLKTVPDLGIGTVEVRDLLINLQKEKEEKATKLSDKHTEVVRAQQKYIEDMATIKEKLLEVKRAMEQGKIVATMDEQTFHAIKTMDPEACKQLLTGMNKQKDLEAMKHIANEDWDALFALHPDELGDGIYNRVTITLQEAIAQQPENMELLEGLLEGTINSNYAKKHMVKLYAQAEMMTELLAISVVGAEDEAAREKLYAQWEAMAKLATLERGLLLADLTKYDEENPTTGVKRTTRIKLEDISFSVTEGVDGQREDIVVNFNIKKEMTSEWFAQGASQSQMSEINQSYHSKYTDDPTSLENAKDAATINELKKEKERLKIATVMSVMQGVTTLVNPIAGGVVSIIGSVLSQSEIDVLSKGLSLGSKLNDGNVGKGMGYASSGVTLANSLLGLQKNLDKIDSKINQLEDNQKNRIFGKGGIIVAKGSSSDKGDVLSGEFALTSPEDIEFLHRVQTEGAIALVKGADLSSYQAKINEIKDMKLDDNKDDRKDSHAQVIHKILNGEGDNLKNFITGEGPFNLEEISVEKLEMIRGSLQALTGRN